MACKYEDRITNRLDFAQFMVLRFGRLFPLHLFALGAFMAWYFLTSGTPLGDHKPIELGISIFLMGGLGITEGFGWNPPSWSISTEFYTYALFGVLVLLGGRKKKVLYAASVVLSMLLLYVVGQPVSKHHELIFFCTNGFFTGALSWQAYKKFSDLASKPDSRVAWTALELAALLAFGYVLFCPVRPFVIGYYFAPLFMAPAVVIFAFEKGRISSALKHRAFVLMGALSYSIYMLHDLMIHAIWGHLAGGVDAAFKLVGIHPLPTWELWLGDLYYAMFAAILLAVSYATYRLIEKPSRDRFRHIANSMKNGREKYMPYQQKFKDELE
jgi:peptidoglycan/LPS O-acetylase OafA/YrhL